MCLTKDIAPHYSGAQSNAADEDLEKCRDVEGGPLASLRLQLNHYVESSGVSGK